MTEDASPASSASSHAAKEPIPQLCARCRSDSRGAGIGTIAGRSREHLLCVYSTSMYKCYGTSSMSNDYHVGTTSSVISMPTPKNSVGLREPLLVGILAIHDVEILVAFLAFWRRRF